MNEHRPFSDVSCVLTGDLNMCMLSLIEKKTKQESENEKGKKKELVSFHQNTAVMVLERLPIHDVTAAREFVTSSNPRSAMLNLRILTCDGLIVLQKGKILKISFWFSLYSKPERNLSEEFDYIIEHTVLRRISA